MPSQDPKRDDRLAAGTPPEQRSVPRSRGSGDLPSSLDLSVGEGRTGGSPSPDLVARLDLSVGAGLTGATPLSDAQAQGLAPGTVLAGRYEVRARLGVGGMGAVYRVLDRERKADIALKVMLPSLLAREKAVERFAHEAELMLRLAHPGIVRVFDVGSDKERGFRFFTMELLEGMTLREWLAAKKEAKEPVAPAEALEITRQLLEALRYAHEITVHRDLKPENVFLLAGPTGAPRAKILDFGIAKLQSAAAFTSTSMALGTAYYMAPEQQTDVANVDARADLYALSVILYEMLTSELPVGAVKTPSTERRAKIAKWRGAAGPTPADAAALPRGVDDLVMRGLEREPENRPASAERMLAEVVAIRTLLERRRSRAPVLAVLGVLAVGASLALTRPWRGPSTPDALRASSAQGERKEGASRARETQPGEEIRTSVRPESQAEAREPPPSVRPERSAAAGGAESKGPAPIRLLDLKPADGTFVARSMTRASARSR